MEAHAEILVVPLKSPVIVCNRTIGEIYVCYDDLTNSNDKDGSCTNFEMS